LFKTLGVVTLLAGAALIAPGVLAATSTCYSANIPEPFLLPDGSLHEAGSLRVCNDRAYSPVAALHRIQVDGMAVGLHLTRKSSGQSDTVNDTVLIFNREADGRLRLLGYAAPDRDRTEMHIFNHPTVKVQVEYLQRAAGTARPVTEPLILIAAR
jgi:hypothetical protein